MSAQPADGENLPTPRRRFVVVGKSRIPKRAQLRMEETRERQLRALDLRKARATYRDIAKALGYASPSAARAAVMSAIKRTEIELAKEVVLLDLQSLDEMQMRCTEAMRKGDLFQVDRILRIMERRYGLLGVGSRTVDELQEQFGISNPQAQINNSGVMVVSASSGTGEFVRALMESMKIDTSDPDVQKKLRALESGEQTEKRRTVVHKKTDDPVYQTTMDEDEIVDAEIVEDEATDD